jgi:2-polyprenyl-6-methoxyphenol hydroxylase-like FAD-dependent oxidoreductase
MRMDSKLRVGIVGAGPAGLTVAVALQRYAPPGSVDVIVLDRYGSTAEYPGLEYGLQARAMRALHRAGADGAARRRGHPVNRFEFHRRGDRRQLALRVDPRWTIGVLRREFLSDLADLVRAPILRGHEVRSIAPAEGGRAVTVGFTGGQADRTFDLLVAADGVNSLARATFFPNQAVLHPRGFGIVYVLADATGVPDHALPPGFLDVADGPVIRFMRGSFATTVWFPAGRRRATLALGADDPSRARLWAEEGLAPDTPWTELPGPVRERLARRIAADTPGSGGFFPGALDLVADWTSPDVYLWSMRDSDPLPQPYAPHAPIVLLGDAAHAFLPTIGMGASLAIEDAEVLADLLASHLRAGGGRDLLRRRVLVPFGKRRHPVWNDLMTRARAAVTNWRHETVDQGYVLSPFVPTRFGSAAMRGYERLRGRTVLGPVADSATPAELTTH